MNTVFLRVTDEEDGDRLDVFLADNTEMSRSRLQKLIKSSKVEVNENIVNKASYNIRDGDKVLVYIPEPEKYHIKPQDLNIEIIYQDSDIALVNKPVDMVVHPSPGHRDGTLVNAILHKCKDLSGINGVLRPGIVHRIDKETSGILIIAKNDFSHVSLSAQLKQKTISKEYLALVYGDVKNESGTIRTLIGRDPNNRLRMTVLSNGGKEAITHYKVLERFDKYTLLSVDLETGRTHQIRVHLDHVGYPIIGDAVYGNKQSKAAFSKGQFLHAKKLEFIHPRSKKRVSFIAALPDDRNQFLKKLRK
jgi:23S rRNA pseudouridine1911/1915/1917 synthase